MVEFLKREEVDVVVACDMTRVEIVCNIQLSVWGQTDGIGINQRRYSGSERRAVRGRKLWILRIRICRSRGARFRRDVCFLPLSLSNPYCSDGEPQLITPVLQLQQPPQPYSKSHSHTSPSRLSSIERTGSSPWVRLGKAGVRTEG